MHEHRLLENLDKYPERRAVYEALQQLHKEHHPALAQYVARVVGPTGMTLREAAAVLGVSYQRVAQLRDKGKRQRLSESARLDLTWWPVLPEAPTRTLPKARIDKDMLHNLRVQSAKARAYRRGQDPRSTLAFYEAVARLHALGISYASIAVALGEEQKPFMRRLARWGVTEGRYGQPGLTEAAQQRKDNREREARRLARKAEREEREND